MNVLARFGVLSLCSHHSRLHQYRRDQQNHCGTARLASGSTLQPLALPRLTWRAWSFFALTLWSAHRQVEGGTDGEEDVLGGNPPHLPGKAGLVSEPNT